MHRVHKKAHLLLRDEALLVPIKDEEAELQHLRDLEEAVGGHCCDKLAKINRFGVGGLDQVKQAITEDRSRYKYNFVVEVRDGYDATSLFIVLLEHVPEHSNVLFLRSERFCQIRTKKHPRPRRTETTRCNEVCKQRDAEIVP